MSEEVKDTSVIAASAPEASEHGSLVESTPDELASKPDAFVDSKEISISDSDPADLLAADEKSEEPVLQEEPTVETDEQKETSLVNVEPELQRSSYVDNSDLVERNEDTEVPTESAFAEQGIHNSQRENPVVHEETIGSLENSAREKFPSSRETSNMESIYDDDQQEPIDSALLDRQLKFVMENKLLSDPEFKAASDDKKISSLMALLNSNTETSMYFMPNRLETPQVTNRQRFRRPDMAEPMSAEEQQRYSEYLHGETKITEIQSFPPKSRLFIGNLPLRHVSKEDLFRIFSPYGHIFQINIKNAFGFIQFDNPKSVLDSIEHESEEMNFGKRLILEVSSSNARPQFDHGDHGTNTSSTYVTSSKRNFEGEENDDDDDMYRDSQYKKTKTRTPQCLIYVKKAADRSYAYNVFTNMSKKTGLDTDMVVLKPRMELRKLVNEAAYDGVWGVVLVNKNKNVDVQTFYQGPGGETKSDEYVGVSTNEAISIFNNMKGKRNQMASIPPPVNASPYGIQSHMAQPSQTYNYMPVQQPYGSAPPMMAPPQQQYTSMPPQNYAMQPPPPQHGYQSYPPQQAPMAPQAGVDQQQLLAALQNLPPNVMSNLLQLAQQPNQQQQALGMIQQIQAGIPLQQQQVDQMQHISPQMHPQQPQQPQQQPQQPQQSYVSYMQPQPNPQQFLVGQPGPQSQTHTPISEPMPTQHPSSHNQAHSQSQSQNQSQTQSQTQNSNNVQSLLDSLAKLQK